MSTLHGLSSIKLKLNIQCFTAVERKLSPCTAHSPGGARSCSLHTGLFIMNFIRNIQERLVANILCFVLIMFQSVYYDQYWSCILLSETGLGVRWQVQVMYITGVSGDHDTTN